MISTIVSVLTFLPLMVVALAHLFWALGATWPIRTDASVSRRRSRARSRLERRIARSVWA